MPGKIKWRTVTRDGKTVTYAVVRRNGQRVVLVKKRG